MNHIKATSSHAANEPWIEDWTVISCVLARVGLPNRIRGRVAPTVALMVVERHKPRYEHRSVWLAGDAEIEVRSAAPEPRERWSLDGMDHVQ